MLGKISELGYRKLGNLYDAVPDKFIFGYNTKIAALVVPAIALRVLVSGANALSSGHVDASGLEYLAQSYPLSETDQLQEFIADHSAFIALQDGEVALATLGGPIEALGPTGGEILPQYIVLEHDSNSTAPAGSCHEIAHKTGEEYKCIHDTMGDMRIAFGYEKDSTIYIGKTVLDNLYRSAAQA